MRFSEKWIWFLSLCWMISTDSRSYPIDGYEATGIRRLLNLQWILDGTLPDKEPINGAQKSIHDIQLNLIGPRGDSLSSFPSPDPGLQSKLNALFPNLDESYSLALLDITYGRPIGYAYRNPNKGYQPGSVGKIAVAIGLFAELRRLFPNSFRDRRELLKSRFVKAGPWSVYDEHTVPFFDPETKKLVKRVVQESDVFSLFEWTDHMLSVSNNAAASIVWREVILMRAFGSAYPVSEQQEEEFWSTTPKSTLSEIGMAVVNEPLRELGISEDEWRLGTMFTRGAGKIVPGRGGSIGTPAALLKFLVAMEAGKVIDKESSLEIKRLMYMTDRRIRYAASTALTDAAVYFKSGSLYQCRTEEGFECKKYMGNLNNYMNSVALVEHPNGITYMVVLMSNVLKKNSSNDHFALASQIDRLVRNR